MLLDEIELSVRTANSFHNLSLQYLGDLVQYTEIELLQTRNFGRKSLHEIKEILANMGFSLGMKHEPWWPEQIKAKGAVPREQLEAEYDDGDEDEEDDESTVLERRCRSGHARTGPRRQSAALRAARRSRRSGLRECRRRPLRRGVDAIQLGDAVYLGDLVQIPRSEVRRGIRRGRGDGDRHRPPNEEPAPRDGLGVVVARRRRQAGERVGPRGHPARPDGPSTPTSPSTRTADEQEDEEHEDTRPLRPPCADEDRRGDPGLGAVHATPNDADPGSNYPVRSATSTRFATSSAASSMGCRPDARWSRRTT